MHKFAWALAVVLFGCGRQDPVPAQDKATLQQLEECQQALLERSAEIVKLKQELASLRLPGPAPAEAVPVGPAHPRVGFVAAIADGWGFLIVSLDQMDPRDEPRPGTSFVIDREEKAIATAEIVKIRGNNHKNLPMLEVKITKGDVHEIRLGDRAVARRAIPVSEPKARVVGSMGRDVYQIDLGLKDGIKLQDEVYVYRNAKRLGSLKVVDLQFDSSVCRGTGCAARVGDEIRLEELPRPRKSIFGKIVNVDRHIIADVGFSAGARPGQKFEVRREGRKIGTLSIRDTAQEISFCDPLDGTPREELRKGDSVELIQE
jgi:hypothetical protein